MKRTVTHLKNNPEKDETYFRSIFNNSRGAELILINRRISEINKAGISLLGITGKENILSLKPSQFSPEFQPDGEKSVEKEQTVMDKVVRLGSFQLEWTYLKPDGSAVPAEILLTSLPSEEAEVIHCSWRDIIDRKIEERFRALVETTSDLIWEIDRNARYSYLSPRVMEILGYKPDELIDKTPFDLMPEESVDKFRRFFPPYRKTGSPFRILKKQVFTKMEPG